MKAILISATLACAALAAPPALAQDRPAGDHAKEAPSTVNTMCPIGKEPIVPSAGTVEYKGKTIGICCPGCGKQFLAWEEARKDEFVTLAAAHREPGTETHGAPETVSTATPEAPGAPGQAWTGPYTLATCPVSGEKLGSMGDPIIKMYDGREVRFCCGGCIGKFESDQGGYWAKIDAKMVTDQLRYNTSDTCVVSGEPLTESGEDIAVNMVYANRLVRLCCKMCQRQFKAEPARFIAKLDKAAADAQRAEYPLDTCPVGGGALGSMGDPAEMVVAGRLIRLCCAMCEPKVKSDPVKYLRMIDTAWQEQGRYLPESHDD